MNPQIRRLILDLGPLAIFVATLGRFGIFTAVLSTPCTFGLFVGLLAWAIALNSPAIGVTMLIMVGIGMASPYFLLSAAPDFSYSDEGGGVIDRIAAIERDGRMILVVDPRALLDRAERDVLATIRNQAEDEQPS